MVKLPSQAPPRLSPASLPPPPAHEPPEVFPSDPSGSPPSDERPHSSAKASMRPFSLRFEPALEREFADEHFARIIGQVRVALALGIFLYTIFGILDLWIAPEQRPQLWFIRYAVVVPTFIAALVLSFRPVFRRLREQTLAVAITIASLGIVAMTFIIPVPGSYLYYAGLLLVVMYTFTLVRLSIPYSTLLAGITVVAYVVVAIWFNETATRLVVNNLFFLVSAVIIGFSANYSMERYARSNFLQRRLIAAHTRELEGINAQLIAKNRMLAESRAVNIRTAQRSELIFAALSDALPGTVLDDKYRVEEKIGSGSFGTVYRGEHLFLHHPVAIKVFRPAVGGSALESLDRFRLEGISACRINHPNAVTVLDFDVSSGSLAYLVMELLQGHSLSDEMRSGRLDHHRSVQIAAAVCDVLAEAHAAGIVHRDIKPSNVFLHRSKTGGGEELVKVIDFGVAKLTDQSGGGDSPTVTVAGTLVGTPEYMAPERVSGGAYDGRADVYAVGVMLYEMLTGQLPFRSDAGYWPVAMMQVSREAVLPSRVNAAIPAELEALVVRAMSKDPARRPLAADLASSLRDWRDGIP